MNTCYNPFTLEGKTILVTGASSGIGRQIAIDCSKMGASVIITGRNEERLKETLDSLSGNNHLSITKDLVEETSIKELVSEIPEIDGAALCAGKGNTNPVLFISMENMLDIFNLNFFSTAELLRLLYKLKKLKKNSSVVLMDSIGGITKFSYGGCAYGASKSALNSFMKFCSREFAQRSVRVNCICPGMVETPFIRPGTISEEQLQADKKNYFKGRYGTPTDVANGAIYLLSDASSWVTGISLIIDGGKSNT